MKPLEFTSVAPLESLPPLWNDLMESLDKVFCSSQTLIDPLEGLCVSPLESVPPLTADSVGFFDKFVLFL